MRAIHLLHLDKARPALILTRETVGARMSKVTVAPITSTIRGLSTEVPVGRANGLDQDSVVSCDNITTVDRGAVGARIGTLLPAQEAALAAAVIAAFDLAAPRPPA